MYTSLTTPINSCEYYDDKHGYQVHRYVELYDNNAEMPKGWSGIERLVKVRRWGFRDNKQFHEVSFYALSKPILSSATAAKVIQDHWHVENKLHWVKDVNFGEDKMTIRKPPKAAILGMLNNAAFNVLRFAGLKPNRDTLAKFANKPYELAKLFKLK